VCDSEFTNKLQAQAMKIDRAGDAAIKQADLKLLAMSREELAMQ
jgi:hypothetical protein